MNTDYNKSLDEILLYLLNKKEITGCASLNNDVGLTDKTQVEIIKENISSVDKKDDWIIEQMLNYLIEEGYILFNPFGGTELKYYQLTFRGIVFIKSGGYVELSRLKNIAYEQDKADLNWKRLSSQVLTWGSVVTAILGMLLLLWDMYKYSRDHYPKIQEFFDKIF